MPYRLRVTQEDVREELARLGFTGLTDTMVAELRKDLLKVIKNDLRKLRQREQKSVAPVSSGCPHTSTPLTAAAPHRLDQAAVCPLGEHDGMQETESGYSDQETTSSLAGPSHSSASSSISGDFNYLKQNLPKKQSKVTDETSFEPGRTVREQPHRQAPEGTQPAGRAGAEHRTAGGVAQGRADTRQQAQSRAAKDKAKRKAQNPLPDYPARPDPVNLYHFYKAHWEQHKVPGEDPRARLRWQVRTRLFYLGHKG